MGGGKRDQPPQLKNDKRPMKNQKHTNMKTKTNSNARTSLNRNKRQFVEAVELMAPGNKFIADVARRVPQDMLPAIAGVAALELASTLELLCKSWRLRRPIESANSFRRRRDGKAVPARDRLRKLTGAPPRNGSAASWESAERVPIVNLTS